MVSQQLLWLDVEKYAGDTLGVYLGIVEEFL